MVPDIDSQKLEPSGLTLKWSRGLSLTARILAVNMFALVLFAAGLFFLDSYRERLIDERESNAAAQAQLIANSLPYIRADGRAAFINTYGAQYRSRIRIYDRDGGKIMDSFDTGKPNRGKSMWHAVWMQYSISLSAHRH
jgi:two-component system, OmpR family, sensor histidine kinase ChvG